MVKTVKNSFNTQQEPSFSRMFEVASASAKLFTDSTKTLKNNQIKNNIHCENGPKWSHYEKKKYAKTFGVRLSRLLLSFRDL